ncbi:tumor necrosis factor receptor superfamily member 13C isoform X4 [Desmodus rotundus]|uniref:tumor necrosis factor receptor superfamily member 13C isoform X4 n=1 Tax=Desmodus rotundus TaxID=9430 RepID=UPI002381862B|nr:tumor necrosis factor receptor superfamily member 13C isoform X4 [Desmodus rotundus]
MPRPAGSPGVKGGPDPTKCVSPQCFDALVRACVACKLFRTPEPRPGAPALLGLALALALVLVALVTLRRRRTRGPASPEARQREQDGPPDKVVVLSSGSPNATAPVWPPPRENSATAPPAHSVPVPATELGSTELVTTKTAGPEQQ